MTGVQHTGFQILIGNDQGEFEVLQKSFNKGKIGWACHRLTQKGDKLFFYFLGKIGEIKATGIAASNAKENLGENPRSSRYWTMVTNLKPVSAKVTREDIRRVIPELKWIDQPRLHKILEKPHAESLFRLVNNQRNVSSNPSKPKVNQITVSDELVGLEGKQLRRMVTHRSREVKLRNAKIAKTKELCGGRLICEVPGCGFEFAEVYGAIGKDFAHVHHLTPLSQLDGAKNTLLEDLAIVCANCHAMIHRGGECRNIETLINR